MNATLYGFLQTGTRNFRRDLIAVIGAVTPQEQNELTLSRAQAAARTFTAMTLCRKWWGKMEFTTPEVEAFLRAGDNLAWVDRLWQRALNRA